MAYNISGFAGAGAQFFDNNGDPLSGGLLYVYTAGTTTPVTTWTSNSGAVANTNPIVLDSAGRTPNEIWLNSGVTYKFVLKTSTGVLIGTYDNIPAIDDPTVFNNLITVTGTNTLIGTSTPPYTAYVAGMTLSFVAVNTNTGAVTISVDGLGAKNIYIGSATALSGGELVAGRIVQLEYDGTRFQLQVGSIADGSITSAKLANAQLTLPNALNYAAPVTLASASSVAIGAAASNNITISGTTTITSFDTIAAGARRNVKFSGALTLTYNATSLILPGAANITTAANDNAEFLSLGGGNWICTSYQRAIPGVNVQQFDSTGTWTKPTGGYTMARIQVWGGGGGGGRYTGSAATGGGGGGAYNEITVPLSYLAASVTATVGAGGTGATATGNGAAGGTTSFALATAWGTISTLYAYGGGGGSGAAGVFGGAGGGQLSAGTTAGALSGSPVIYASDNATVFAQLGAGGNGANSNGGGNIFGGGGGGGGSFNGGNSVYGGGGGAPTGATAGVSVHGGNGGANAAGTAPGGGGGSSSSANVNGSNGAAGRIIITCW